MTNDSEGLVIRNLAVAYGRKKVVRSFSLGPVPRGAVLALLGPNAAGKSTLLRGIAGLGSTSGQVFLDGIDVSRLSRVERAKKIVYMPQSQPPGPDPAAESGLGVRTRYAFVHQ